MERPLTNIIPTSGSNDEQIQQITVLQVLSWACIDIFWGRYMRQRLQQFVLPVNDTFQLLRALREDEEDEDGGGLEMRTM